VQVPWRQVSLMHWWNSGLDSASSATKNRHATVRIYTTWNIWKERNRRVFDSIASTPHRVLQLVKDEMATGFTACEMEVHLVVF
jgi:hypothetical protein